MFCGYKTFFCKFGRAVLRVAVAVAVVAVIAFAPVAALALAKKASLLLTYSDFMFKGIKLGHIIGLPLKLFLSRILPIRRGGEETAKKEIINLNRYRSL